MHGLITDPHVSADTPLTDAERAQVERHDHLMGWCKAVEALACGLAICVTIGALRGRWRSFEFAAYVLAAVASLIKSAVKRRFEQPAPGG